MNNNRDDKQLSDLFDLHYGSLKGSTILTEEEYEKHKKFSIESGLFEYQLQHSLNQNPELLSK